MIFFRAFVWGEYTPSKFEISPLPQTITNFVCLFFFACFSHFLSPQKQYPLPPSPQNYISRKKNLEPVLLHQYCSFHSVCAVVWLSIRMAPWTPPSLTRRRPLALEHSDSCWQESSKSAQQSLCSHKLCINANVNDIED